MTQVNDRRAESDETFQREVLERFDADAPPEAFVPERPVACENCWTRFPAKYEWEPSLPPHNCTERAARRKSTAGVR